VDDRIAAVGGGDQARQVQQFALHDFDSGIGRRPTPVATARPHRDTPGREGLH